MEIQAVLTQFWLSKKQAELFITLYQVWPKPASTLAKMVWEERTNTYKMLQTLIRLWFVAETSKQWIKQFYIPDKEVLRQRVMHQKQEIESQEQLLPLIESSLSKLDQKRISPLPKMRFFEGKPWIEALFDDLLRITQQQGYLVIKCFWSNTVESQSQSWKQLQDYAGSFLEQCAENQITLETYLGNGILTLEQIIKSTDLQTVAELPAGNASLNLFVSGETVYLLIFKSVPFGLKLESPEFADVLHFFFKQFA